MDKAKAAVSDFMHKSGHHDTTVHETVAPAVQHETVKQHQHEEVITAVDKESHQDHYHRTVQPVKDREVLPEKHEAKLGAVQHREFDHRDHDTTKRNLAQEQQAFRDERVIADKTYSQSAAPVVGGEHVHHVCSHSLTSFPKHNTLTLLSTSTRPSSLWYIRRLSSLQSSTPRSLFMRSTTTLPSTTRHPSFPL
jgi:ribosomal protein L19E